MMVRSISAFAIVVAFGNTVWAQQVGESPRVGDHLVIRMTGEVAKAYARCIGSPAEEAKGLEIATITTVAQRFGNGRIRVELTSPVKTDGGQSQLVTLSAMLDLAKVKTNIIPKDTPIYGSPAEQKNFATPKLTTEESKSRHLELSNLKDVKLRTWTLSEEIGHLPESPTPLHRFSGK